MEDSIARMDKTTTSRHSPIFLSDKDASSPPAPKPSSPLDLTDDCFSIVVPPVQRPWEYQVYEDDNTISEILEEIVGQHNVKYFVRFRDGHERTVSQPSP